MRAFTVMQTPMIQWDCPQDAVAPSNAPCMKAEPAGLQLPSDGKPHHR